MMIKLITIGLLPSKPSIYVTSTPIGLAGVEVTYIFLLLGGDYYFFTD